VSLSNVEITGNQSYSGGGLAMVGGILDIQAGTTIDKNKADNSNGVGGGLYLAGGTTTISGANIRDNPGADGGGMYITGAATTVTITGDTLVHNNTGAWRGGGIDIVSGTLYITGGATYIYGNTATEGGGVWNDGTVKMKYGTIIGSADFITGSLHYQQNTATDGTAASINKAVPYDGASLYIWNGSAYGGAQTSVSNQNNTVAAWPPS
jgi:hypothetical protein